MNFVKKKKKNILQGNWPVWTPEDGRKYYSLMRHCFHNKNGMKISLLMFSVCQSGEDFIRIWEIFFVQRENMDQAMPKCQIAFGSIKMWLWASLLVFVWAVMSGSFKRITLQLTITIWQRIYSRRKLSLLDYCYTSLVVFSGWFRLLSGEKYAV